jgi:hypothetical protein
VGLALVGTGSLSAVGWARWLAAGGAMFLATRVLTGELSLSHVEAIPSLAKKALRNG